jgi:hypothetical protein
MAMIGNEAGVQPALEALLDEEDKDDDGWGPVRLRRSSMPVPLSAESAHDAEGIVPQKPSKAAE